MFYQVATTSDTESTSASTSQTITTPAPVQLHPRKRKLKPNKEVPTSASNQEQPEATAVSEVHPHEQPITNCYQLYLNIRKQVCCRFTYYYLINGCTGVWHCNIVFLQFNFCFVE